MSKPQEMITLSITENQSIELIRLLDNGVMDTSSNGKARTYNALLRQLDRLSVQRSRARQKAARCGEANWPE